MHTNFRRSDLSRKLVASSVPITPRRHQPPVARTAYLSAEVKWQPTGNYSRPSGNSRGGRRNVRIAGCWAALLKEFALKLRLDSTITLAPCLDLLRSVGIGCLIEAGPTLLDGAYTARRDVDWARAVQDRLGIDDFVFSYRYYEVAPDDQASHTLGAPPSSSSTMVTGRSAK